MINLKEGRKGFESIGNTYPVQRSILRENTKIADVSCAWFTPAGATEDDIVIYIHGGAFIFGSIDSHAPMVSHIAYKFSRKVLVIDYHLAPEYPFPAGINDCIAVIKTICEKNPKLTYGIIGDSAGGNLTMAANLILKGTYAPKPAYTIVISPWVDLECKNASYDRNKLADTVLSRPYLIESAQLYAAGSNLSDPLLSPVNGDFHGLAPVLILCGSHEILKDDAVKLHKQLTDQGVEAELQLFEGEQHVWPFMDISSEASVEALNNMADFAARQTSTLYDVIVVGGGSAGAVMASRLSENQSRKVLLLEGGKVYAPENYPEVIAKADHVTGDKDHDWGYEADSGISGRKIHAFRGKVLGGSSGVNAAVAIRARKSDFDNWVKLGLKDWAFEEVLETYRQMERTRDGEDPIRGRTGPFPIRQVPVEELTPGLSAFIRAAENEGFKRIADFNGYEQDGVGPYPLNVLNGIRENTGMTYLNAEVRKRPNLTIIGDQTIDRVLIENQKAKGVVSADGKQYFGNEVILSAGAYGSPAILMRSGIGPGEDLEALGIPVIKDLPVGKKLYEHPFYYNVYELKKEANAMSPAAGAILWTRSSNAPEGELDIHVSATHLFDPQLTKTGGAIVLACAVTTPQSKGRVKLQSADPLAAPIIEFSMFKEPNDLQRMVEAVKMSRQIGLDSVFGSIKQREIYPGEAVKDDDELIKAILEQADIYQHPASTVPMGLENDPEAVVDGWGKVFGIAGLRVADASIMPYIVSAPPNVTTIMMAEHISKNAYAFFEQKPSE